MEALREAKAAGKVRFLGITSHKRQLVCVASRRANSTP